MLTPFAERLRDYLRAGYPALAVVTHEEERLLGDLRTLGAAGWGVVAWTMARGWVDADGKVLNQGQGDPVRAVQGLMTLPEKTVAVFFDLHPYFAQLPELVRSVRDALPAAKATQRPLLLCSPEPTLPIEWEKDVALLDYPLPAREALQDLLEELVGPAKITLPPAVRDAMLEAARGLTWNEAENAFALALMRDRARVAAMPATVQHEKTALVRKSGLLDLLDPAETLETVGGLAPLKAWVAAQGALLSRAADALAWGFGPAGPSEGGPPAGRPGHRQEPARPRDRRQLGPPTPPARDGPRARKPRWPVRGADPERPAAGPGHGALRAARRRDREDPRRRGCRPPGLGRHQPGRREPAHLAPGARGRPGRRPGAGVRRGDGQPRRGAPAGAVPPGTFDQVFFLDLPEPAERAAVLEIHLRIRRQTIPSQAIESVADRTEGYSAAELEQVVKAACLRAFQEGGRRLQPADLDAARATVTPLAESRAEEIGAIRTWARTRAQRANGPAAPADAGAGRRRLAE